jgi:polysaccharide pyruvyl transferase WcaK-like protein
MKFGLIGTFDTENYGDCIFPELYATFLRRRFSDSEFKLYSPTSRAAKVLSFERVEALPSYATTDRLRIFDVDILILIGGETIGYGHSSGTFNFPRPTLSAYLRLWLAPILAVQATDQRPVFFAAQGVGAIKMPVEICKRVASCLAAADRVRFRDHFSAEWIRSSTYNFDVDIDPMFLIDGLKQREEWERRAASHLPAKIAVEEYLVVQVSVGYSNNDWDVWVKAVKEIAVAEGKFIVLLPICHFMEDEILLTRLQARLKVAGLPSHLVSGRINVKDVAALIGMSAGYVGSSLHGAVTAVSFGRPLAVLGHTPDGKHSGTLQSVNIFGVTTTQSQELPECFRRSRARDQVADRRTAQDLARASIDKLMDAIAEHRSEADSAAFDHASQDLLDRERTPHPREDLKRAVLRLVRKIPGLSALYRQFRIQKAFR